MRRSLFGSIGWFGSVYSPRLPSPLVSMIRAVQPTDWAGSWVSSHFLTLIQPTTPPPPPLEVQSVLLASWAKFRWCVVKQTSTKSYFWVFGSNTVICRPLTATGVSLADGWFRSLQYAGCFFSSRNDAAI